MCITFSKLICDTVCSTTALKSLMLKKLINMCCIYLLDIQAYDCEETELEIFYFFFSRKEQGRACNFMKIQVFC